MSISKHEDKSFKILIDFAMVDFLRGIGIDEEIVIPLPTELMTTDCVNRRMDYCGLSRNYEIINVEFQSTLLTKEDELRIFDYASSLFVKHKLPVKTYIISTAEDKSRKIEKWHHNDVFTIYVISLKDKDGLESLNRIKSKIENNETLNKQDAVQLISIVFMKSDLSETELLFETAHLTNKAQFVSDFIRDIVKAIQLILGDKFIKNEEEFKHFKEIVNMVIFYETPVFNRIAHDVRKETLKESKERFLEQGRLIGLDEGVKLGRYKGREEGDEERAIFVARWMLDKGMSIDDIKEATGLSIDKINSLKEE